MNGSSNCWSNEPPPPAGESEGLVFPNWSGQVATKARVPTDQWFQYCRSNLKQLRSRPGYARRRRQNGVAAEFSL